MVRCLLRRVITNKKTKKTMMYKIEHTAICKECGSAFEDFLELKIHYRTKHPDKFRTVKRWLDNQLSSLYDVIKTAYGDDENE